MAQSGKNREGMMPVQISFTGRITVADTRKEEGRNKLTINCQTRVSPLSDLPQTERDQSETREEEQRKRSKSEKVETMLFTSA